MRELISKEPQIKNWRDELVESLKLSNFAENWLSLDDSDKQRVNNAKQRFPLMVPVNYANLVDWQNPADPLRQLLLP
ncbi:MAG: KamA family radical SAM protein, partial [Cyanobacteria bacterium P01_D01_bin.116]